MMNIEEARHNMVWQQVRPWETASQTVLDLITLIKREDFVPPAYQKLAFADTELPLGKGEGQSMLHPRVEARLLQALLIQPTDKVLEIGTGSGYMAALLAACSTEVTTLEIDPVLAETARANLKRAGIFNVEVITGDGSKGWEAFAPYNVIVISGGIPQLPEAILQQLRPKGRLAAIVGQPPAMRAQIVSRDDKGFTTQSLFETVLPMMQNFAAKPVFQL